MGASGWSYVVDYRPDLQAALTDLREQVFVTGQFYSLWDEEWASGISVPPPRTLADLEAAMRVDELVGTEGTHSILDCPRIQAPRDAGPDWYDHGSVVPATDGELVAAVGTARPTRAHLASLDATLDQARWVGRCVVLFGTDGHPESIAFFGYSGD